LQLHEASVVAVGLGWHGGILTDADDGERQPVLPGKGRFHLR
jgi:hypothetical protein